MKAIPLIPKTYSNLPIKGSRSIGSKSRTQISAGREIGSLAEELRNVSLCCHKEGKAHRRAWGVLRKDIQQPTVPCSGYVQYTHSHVNISTWHVKGGKKCNPPPQKKTKKEKGGMLRKHFGVLTFLCGMLRKCAREDTLTHTFSHTHSGMSDLAGAYSGNTR